MSFEQTAALARLYVTQEMNSRRSRRMTLRASYDMSSFSDPDTFGEPQLPQTLKTLQRSYAYLTSIAQLERKLLTQCDDTSRVLAR